MEIRDPIHPEDFETFTTEGIRQEFLIQDLFVPGEIRLVYSHFDAMIVGGVCPDKPIPLEDSKEIGSGFFLERREMRMGDDWRESNLYRYGCSGNG